ncbi:MAG: NYN domain-containing protein, partial [Minisyncoccia bacterium]
MKLIVDESGRKLEKANFDVEMTGDILEYKKEFDILILFSGDSDFAYLVEILHRRNKEVFVYSSRRTFSWELKIKADRYFLLEKLKNLTKDALDEKHRLHFCIKPYQEV